MIAAQTVIEGITPPPAPKATTNFVKAAVLAFIERNNIEWGDKEQAADDIAAEWSSYMDGYELARKLDDDHSWEITTQDVEDLDCIGSVVREAVEEARKAWALQWDIQPPHPIGTRIKARNSRARGVITGLYQHGGATYEVKEDGCTDETRRLLVKFEDAEVAE